MGHFDFVRVGGQWPVELVPGANDYQGWDWRQSKLLCGDTGDTRAPTAPIIVGGAGVHLQPSGATAYIQGGVRTQTAGRLVLGKYDIPALLPARPFQTVFSLATVSPSQIVAELLPSTTPGGTSFYWRPDDYFQAVASPTGSGLFVVGNTQWVPPRPELPQGAQSFLIPVPPSYLNFAASAKLSSITLSFRVLRPDTVPVSGLIVGLVNQASATAQPFGAIQLIDQGLLTTWQRDTDYAVGQYVIPLNNRGAPLSYYRCISAGLSTQFLEPVWPTTPGSTITDGNIFFGAVVVWECVGPVGQGYGLTQGATVVDAQQYYAGGAVQTITAAFDTSLPANLSPSGSYAIVVSSVPTDGSILYHAVTFTYENLTQLAPP